MNYRHAYHAGNFADVLKHATLALVIEHLKKKPGPFRVLDTHAGIGAYDLASIEARKTGEWTTGIGRLLDEPLPADIADLLAPYLSAVAAADRNFTTSGRVALSRYPGSPDVARHLMRAGDRLVANELHPDDFASLSRHVAGDRRVMVTNIDAWTAIKAHLPPPERRGLTLVDPPFEEPDEFGRLVDGARQACRRFATGILMGWYPIKDPDQVDWFRSAIVTSGVANALDVELAVAEEGPGLVGCGVLIVNPPYGLDGKLERLAEFLATRLARDRRAGFRIEWLTRDGVPSG